MTYILGYFTRMHFSSFGDRASYVVEQAPHFCISYCIEYKYGARPRTRTEIGMRPLVDDEIHTVVPVCSIYVAPDTSICRPFAHVEC